MVALFLSVARLVPIPPPGHFVPAEKLLRSRVLSWFSLLRPVQHEHVRALAEKVTRGHRAHERLQLNQHHQLVDCRFQVQPLGAVPLADLLDQPAQLRALLL